MKIIDISWPIINGMTEYKDRSDLAFHHDKVFEKDNVRSSRITIGSHTGTHVDAPSHFLADGGSIEALSLETLVGPCRVLDMSHVANAITIDELQKCDIKQGQRILLRTTNSTRGATQKFDYDFVYLEKSGAQFLAEKGVTAVGIDYLGIERNQPDHESHEYLLKVGIPIIEGLRLEHVEAGEYVMYCLPLAVQGLEAAPARAILIC